MPELKYLNAQTILHGKLEKKEQYYHLIALDEAENSYTIAFKCLSCYSESVDKAFRRLSPVHFREEKKEIGESSNA